MKSDWVLKDMFVVMGWNESGMQLLAKAVRFQQSRWMTREWRRDERLRRMIMMKWMIKMRGRIMGRIEGK